MENLLREILAELKRHHEYIRLRDVRLDMTQAAMEKIARASFQNAMNAMTPAGVVTIKEPEGKPS